MAFKFVEMEKYPVLEKFLKQVKKDQAVEFFKSPDDFSGKLYHSFGKLKENQSSAEI